MRELRTLMQVLEASVKKNGEIPLTNKHLLNILRMVDRVHDDWEKESILKELASEYEAEDFGDR